MRKLFGIVGAMALCLACVGEASAWSGVARFRVRAPVVRQRVVVQRQVVAAPLVVAQPFVQHYQVAPIVVPQVQSFVVPQVQAFTVPNGCHSGVSASLLFR